MGVVDEAVLFERYRKLQLKLAEQRARVETRNRSSFQRTCCRCRLPKSLIGSTKIGKKFLCAECR
jgi:hypothetical protein